MVFGKNCEMLLKHPIFRVFGVFRGKKIPSLIALEA
jgi:hypothetical protein